MRRLLALCAALCALPAAAADDYHLVPQKVAEGVYVLQGRLENFSRDNGGNIVNTGFLVGPDGVIVIDTGPSRRYGEQQRAAIARLTPKPVVQVYVTHAHPDHFFGDQAYPAAQIAALPGTIEAINRNGSALADNMYRMAGAWMQGTEPVAPGQAIRAGTVNVAGRRLTLLAFEGHTEADLAVFDEATQTLFAGDLVFSRRAPTTPNADLPHWFASLAALSQRHFTALVPGHGPPAHDAGAITETRDYLQWLDQSLHAAAARGLDMTEVMALPLPARFQSLAVIDGEYPRSIAHLYPAIERATLPALH